MSAFEIRATGNWGPSQVQTRPVPSTRQIDPKVESAIALAWEAATSRKGIHLFDGPMCRLEQWNATSDSLHLALSPTSYQIFLGTNLHNASRFESQFMANPVGLSTLLHSADGYLLLGWRSATVAYYPQRVHPFAGALEPAGQVDVFAEVRRELREELAMGAGQIADIRCIGLVEDRSLRQPELIFLTQTPLKRGQIESTLDAAEHHAVFAVRAEHEDVTRAVADPILTPVASAALTLWRDRPHLPPA